MGSNKLAWSIILVLVAATLLWLLSSASAPLPPTQLGASAANLGKLQLPVSPASVLPAMDEASDAAALYQQALDAYRAHPEVYQRIIQTHHLEASDLRELNAITFLLQATARSRMSFFEQMPGQLINYQSSPQPLGTLHSLGQIANFAGLTLGGTQPHEARRYHQAALSLGVKLFDERLTYEELEAGLSLMSESATALAGLEERTGHAEAGRPYRAFVRATLEYDREHIKPIIQAIKTIDPQRIARHTGDVLVFATKSGERVWRVEATLQLGRYRFNAARAADQATANKTLDTLLSDADPAVRTAAAAGSSLTVEQYRAQGQ